MREPNWVKVGVQFNHDRAKIRAELEKLAITDGVVYDDSDTSDGTELTLDLSGDWPAEAIRGDIVSAARKAGLRRVWIDDECFVVRTGESCL